MKIYLTLWRRPTDEDKYKTYVGIALAETGKVLAIANSSNYHYARKDLGFDESIAHHDDYQDYTQGDYFLVWIDQPTKHNDFLNALSLNHSPAFRRNNPDDIRVLKYRVSKEKKAFKPKTMKAAE